MPIDSCRCASKKAPLKIKFKGAQYVRVAQLQQLLQQYETESNAVLKGTKLIQDALQNAHKAAMGKQPEQTLKILQQIQTSIPKFAEEANTRIKSLIEQANTIAGHLGMGGA